jgi:hypothetical protein
MEAAHLYQNLGKIKEALDCIIGYEDDSDVRSLLAQLKLTHARFLIQQGKADEVEELVKTARPLFEKEQDHSKAAECLLLRASTSFTKRNEHLQRASELFAKAACTVGEVECAFQMVKLCPTLCTQTQCEAVLLRAIKKGLDLVASLLHPNGGTTGIAREGVKLCENFYGLRNSSSPEKLEVLIHEAPRILRNHHVNPDSMGSEMSKVDVHNMIIKELLTKKLTLICHFVRQEFQKTRQALMPCAPYRLGGVCQGAISGCPFMHTSSTKDSFGRLVRLTLPLIELDSYLATALNSDSLTDVVKESVRHLTDGDVYRNCAELVGMFYPIDRMETFMFSNVHRTLDIMKKVRNSETIGHLLRYADVKKEEYSGKSKYADILSADMFFCLQMVYLLCGKKEKMNQVLTRTTQANVPNSIIAVGFEWVQDHHDSKKKVSVNVFYHLFNMFHILYQMRNPKEAIASCNKYFFLVTKREEPLMVPSYSNTMMMMEYLLALNTCMYLRHSLDASFTFIPKSYLAHITFWDCAIGGNKKSTFSCVQNFVVEPHYLKRLKGGLWSLVKVFSGFESEYFYMWASLNHSESCMNGVAERVFVFALTLFLNVNLMIPNFQRDRRYSLENLLMYDIDRLDLAKSPCSQRLKDAVQAVKVAKGHKDIAKVLGKLLIQRGEEGLMRCVWKGDDGSSKPKVHCQKLDSYDTFFQGFHHFKHDDLKESKSKEAVREELSSGKAESDVEGQVSLAFIQNDPEEQAMAQPSTEAATSQGGLEEDEDPDLRVDDTMCSTCGVHFLEVQQGPAFADEAGDTQAVESGSPSTAAAQISDNGDGASKPDVITRQDHEASDEHKKKVEDCMIFKHNLNKNVMSIADKAKTLMTMTHPTLKDEEMKVPKHSIQMHQRALHKCIETVRSKRDWANWDEVREAARKLFESNNDVWYFLCHSSEVF